MNIISNKDAIIKYDLLLSRYYYEVNESDIASQNHFYDYECILKS